MWNLKHKGMSTAKQKQACRYRKQTSGSQLEEEKEEGCDGVWNLRDSLPCIR